MTILLAPTAAYHPAVGPTGSMAIVIENILEPTSNGVRALVHHDGRQLDVEVVADKNKLEGAVGQSLFVELGFQEVVSWKTLALADADDHGLDQTSDGDRIVTVVGAVHNVVRLDDVSSLYDVSLPREPEFITFESEDLTGTPPKVGDVIQVVVRGVCFYPSWP